MAVLIETSLGDIVIDLFVDDCPLATKNFLKLCKQKFYNGALFMNLQKHYLTEFQTELPPRTIYGSEYFEDQALNLRKHERLGLVGTANRGPNQNNSNFYITLGAPLEGLNRKHTVFGQVQEGLEVLQRINEIHVDDNNRPLLNLRIKHTIVLDDPFPDPEGMKFPDKSPQIKYKGYGRMEFEEKEDFIQLSNQHELVDLAQEHKAKSRAVMLEMLDDIPDADIKPPENVLFVCKLNPITEEKDLEIIFSKFGPIRACELVRDWKTGQSLQYAFVEFEQTASCEEAYLKMENAMIDDRRIHVDFCQSVAKQWAQLKKSQRKRKILAEQRNIMRQNRDSNQTMIEQLEVKHDYFNTKNNFNYIVDAPPPPPQPSLPVVQPPPPVEQKVNKPPAKKRSKSPSSSSSSFSLKSSSRSSSSSASSKRRKNKREKSQREKSRKKSRHRSRSNEKKHRRRR